MRPKVQVILAPWAPPLALASRVVALVAAQQSGPASEAATVVPVEDLMFVAQTIATPECNKVEKYTQCTSVYQMNEVEVHKTPMHDARSQFANLN